MLSRVRMKSKSAGEKLYFLDVICLIGEVVA